MSGARPTPAGRYLRFVALLVACAVGLVLAGWVPTKRLGGEVAVRAMIAGCALSFIASLIGSLPLLAAGLRGRDAGVTSFLGSLGLRLSVVLAATAAVALLGVFEPRPFLIWVGISYPVLLVADARYALSEQQHR